MEKFNCELWDMYLEWGTDETAEETMAEKLPNFMETISQQSSMNPKHKKYKEHYSKAHHDQIA